MHVSYASCTPGNAFCFPQSVARHHAEGVAVIAKRLVAAAVIRSMQIRCGAIRAISTCQRSFSAFVECCEQSTLRMKIWLLRLFHLSRNLRARALWSATQARGAFARPLMHLYGLTSETFFPWMFAEL